MLYKIRRKGSAGVFSIRADSDSEAREEAIRWFGALIFETSWIKVVQVQSSRDVRMDEEAIPSDEEVERMLADAD